MLADSGYEYEFSRSVFEIPYTDIETIASGFVIMIQIDASFTVPQIPEKEKYAGTEIDPNVFFRWLRRKSHAYVNMC